MPQPSEGWGRCKRYLSPSVVLEDVQGRVNDLLDRIADKVGQPLAMILIVDEGQEFDKYCSESIPIGGARYVMRWLRDLQRGVKLGNAKRERKHKLLGIMTGIDPQVSLSNRTVGMNVCYSSVLHEMTGYTEIASQLFKMSNMIFDKPQERRLVTTFYPHARELTGYLLSMETKILHRNARLPESLFHKRTGDLVDLMLATGLKCNVTMKWDQQIPVVFAADSGGTHSNRQKHQQTKNPDVPMPDIVYLHACDGGANDDPGCGGLAGLRTVPIHRHGIFRDKP